MVLLPLLPALPALLLFLYNTYHQVQVAKENREKIAFTCEKKHFEFTAMTFGLTNTPATFQRLVTEAMGPYINKFVQVYLDDIMIYSRM